MMRKNRGFTLIELMIVITIIAIVVAIALPNLMRMRLQSNEAAAIGRLRALSTGQVSFHGAHNRYGDFDDLMSKDPPWVDGTWEDGTVRYGYEYTMPTVDADNFEAHGDPEIEHTTGIRFFYVDGSGIIRQEIDGQAGPDSIPIPK